MSCFGCNRKYGLFCKEFGCPNCGYSYCNKCLKRPIEVPRHDNKVLNVCLICYDKLTKLQNTEKVIDVESLPGVIVTKVPKIATPIPKTEGPALLDGEPPSDLSTVLTPQNMPGPSDVENAEIAENLDSEISKRLKNLKTVNEQPSDDEMRSRLSNLKGMPNKSYDKKDLLLSTDKRSDQEKMKDLLEQFLGEAEIDTKVETERKDAISDIERRLRALRDAPIDSQSNDQKPLYNNDTPSDNEEDEETVLKKVMEKYLAEARLSGSQTSLEKELDQSIPKPPPGFTPAQQQELPWCNICNEDAIYRCKGCDGELFCRQCFKECHDDDEEYRNHIKENYSAPPNFKENHF